MRLSARHDARRSQLTFPEKLMTMGIPMIRGKSFFKSLPFGFIASLLLMPPLSAENSRVLLRTEYGDLLIEVYADQAPVTSNNFLRYVDAGLYDGTVFHRTVTPFNQPNDAVRIEVLQGGMIPRESSFPPIEHETTDQTGLRHCDGAVSMARLAPGTAASSFFICIGEQPELDFGGRRNGDGQGFAAFGRVIEGMEVVRTIHAGPAERQQLRPPVIILFIVRIQEQHHSK